MRERNDLLLLGNAPNSGNTVAVPRRPFKVQCIGCLLHSLGQQLHRLHSAGADKLQRLVQCFTVRLAADFAAAHPHALMNMKIKARALPAEILRKPSPAGRQQKDAVRLLYRLLYHHRGNEWPDVFVVIVSLLQCQPDPGVLLFGYANIVIALVVLQQDIIFRAVQLDETAFQHQRLKLAVGHDVIEVLNLLHHAVDLGQMPLYPAKIGGHAVFQLFRLSHINNLSAPVAHQINPRLQRQRVGFFAQLGYLLHIHRAAPPFRPLLYHKTQQSKKPLLRHVAQPKPSCGRLMRTSSASAAPPPGLRPALRRPSLCPKSRPSPQTKGCGSFCSFPHLFL